MANVGAPLCLGSTIQEHGEHFTQYGFDISIISGSYGGHNRHMMYDGRRTTLWV